MKAKITDIIFQCEKCQHLLYVDLAKHPTAKEVGELLNETSCPNCGEEFCWKYFRLGNYEKEWGN